MGDQHPGDAKVANGELERILLESLELWLVFVPGIVVVPLASLHWLNPIADEPIAGLVDVVRVRGHGQVMSMMRFEKGQDAVEMSKHDDSKVLAVDNVNNDG